MKSFCLRQSSEKGSKSSDACFPSTAIFVYESLHWSFVFPAGCRADSRRTQSRCLVSPEKISLDRNLFLAFITSLEDERLPLSALLPPRFALFAVNNYFRFLISICSLEQAECEVWIELLWLTGLLRVLSHNDLLNNRKFHYQRLGMSLTTPRALNDKKVPELMSPRELYELLLVVSRQQNCKV